MPSCPPFILRYPLLPVRRAPNLLALAVMHAIYVL